MTRLSEDHGGLLDSFVCTASEAVEPVVTFLRTNALKEQAAKLSTTYVLLNDRRIDAYVTTSVTAWELPSRFREKKGIGRPFVPAVLIGYIGVSDAARKAQKNLGRLIFEGVKQNALEMNALAGVRLVVLEVEARNWRAYQIYRTSWEMLPLSLTIDGTTVQAPDPAQRKCPPHIPPDYKLRMVYDLALLG